MDPHPVIVQAAFDLFAPTHLIIILIIALLLFGRRLPEIMRGLGSSVKEFRKGMNEEPPAHPPAAQNQATAVPPAPAAPAAPGGTVSREAGAGQPPKA